jgi:phosphohistidine phosphatase
VRAIQTAEIVGKTIGMRPRILDCLACGMDIDVLLRALLPHSREKTILVVGHEPDLSLAVADLLGVADPVLIDVRKASLLGSEIMNWHEPSGSLLYSVPVSLM